MNEFGVECLVVARRALILVVSFVLLVAVLSGLLLWRLTLRPLDITPYVSRVLPVTVARGIGHHPAGRLTWQHLSLFWDHAGRGRASDLVLSATNLAISQTNGKVADSLADVSVRLGMHDLLRHRVAPSVVSAHGVRLALQRRRDGSVDLDLPDMRPGGAPPPISLLQLQRIALADGRITLRDAVSNTVIAIDAIQASGRRGTGDTWLGTMGMMVRARGESARVALSSHAGSGSSTEWSYESSAVTPAALAPFTAAAPDVARTLSEWHVPVALRASARTIPTSVHDHRALALLPGMAFAGMSAQIWLGDGSVGQMRGPDLHVRAGQVTAAIDMPGPAQARAATLRITQAVIALNDPTHPDVPDTVFSADAHINADDLAKPLVIDGDAHASASTLDFATLGAVWPGSIMRGAQIWVTRNITAGTGRGLSAHAHIHADHGLSSLTATALDGGMTADGLRLAWLAPVPPVENLQASATFDGPNALVLKFGHGTQLTRAGPLMVPSGSMRINGLMVKDQDADISVDSSGSLARFVALLSERRLNLLSRHPFPFSDPQGEVQSTVALHLPLTARVRVSDITLHAQADFTRVHLGNVVLGRSVDDGRGHLEATTKALDVVAHDPLSGVPTDVTVHEDFTDGAPDRITRHIHAVSYLDPDNVVRAGIAPPGLFQGQLELTSDYRARPDGRADMDLDLDLTRADLSVPVWHKARGISADARAHLAIAGGQITAVDAIEAAGPELNVTGHSAVADGTIRAVVLDTFRVSRSTGHATIGVPRSDHEPIAVSVTADTLDLAPLVHSSTPAHPAAPGRNKRGWIIDLAAHRLFYSQTGALGTVTAHLENDGVHLARGTIHVVDPTAVVVTIAPAARERHVAIDIADFGRLLSALGVTERVAGGHAVLAGDFHDPMARVTPHNPSGTPPFDGTLDIGEFAFLNPPGALTAASHLSVYDWSKSNAQHFEVTRMHLPLHLDRPILHIHDGRLGNDELGATVQGDADLSAQTLNLRGTIVPVFAINALPGRLPGVGRVFSPEKGGGLLATTFRVTGPMGQPAVHVQPLSMLLPGALRNLVE